MGQLLEDNSTAPSPALEPLGQWGWLTRWPDETAAAAWADIARNERWPCSLEIVAAYRSVAAIPTGETTHGQWSELHAALKVSIDRFADFGAGREKHDHERQVIEVPVVYDGPDLLYVADALGLEPRQVVALHSSAVYQVFAVGFLPGFPYAGYLPEALAGLPRRASPRARVPAGSVAIAGRQTGIYPCESPGGWHILGHTPLTICDLERGFFRFRPTDRIRFVPIFEGTSSPVE
ncbi:carboxyltransferase domain-containing protein [bacterium]|nr:carboxyltransferase domain-containing protein [bacterium]